MAGFVKVKTDIQCRSHHHKYETKYKYSYRIIKGERLKLEAQGVPFEETLLKSRQSPIHPKQ